MDSTEGKATPRLIAMAVSLCGDAETVCKAMRCSDGDFMEYAQGKKELPWPELDRLISLIIHEQGIIIAKNRDMLAELRAKKRR